jgi:hypothetical protein
LKTRIVYIVAIATVLAGLAITYYFNLKGLETPISSPAPTYTLAVKAITIGFLKIDVFSIEEGKYLNIYTTSSSECIKATSNMKFVVLGIRIENVGSRDLTSDELSRNPPFKDLVLVTNTSRDYRFSSFPASPYIVPAPQNECMEHNAIQVNFAGSKTFYVLKPSEYLEGPMPFVVLQNEVPSELQFVKDGWTVATISLR